MKQDVCTLVSQSTEAATTTQQQQQQTTGSFDAAMGEATTVLSNGTEVLLGEVSSAVEGWKRGVEEREKGVSEWLQAYDTAMDLL